MQGEVADKRGLVLAQGLGDCVRKGIVNYVIYPSPPIFKFSKKENKKRKEKKRKKKEEICTSIISSKNEKGK